MSTAWVALYFPEDESVTILKRAQAIKAGTLQFSKEGNISVCYSKIWYKAVLIAEGELIKK